MGGVEPLPPANDEETRRAVRRRRKQWKIEKLRSELRELEQKS